LDNTPAAKDLRLKKGAQVLLLANLDVKGTFRFPLLLPSTSLYMLTPLCSQVVSSTVPAVSSSTGSPLPKCLMKKPFKVKRRNLEELDESVPRNGGRKQPTSSLSNKNRFFTPWCTSQSDEKASLPSRHHTSSISANHFLARTVIVRPHSWCIDFDKYNTVARTQIPLQLAWALTIHKSQGQSLDAVCVRLQKTFEKGQCVPIASTENANHELSFLSHYPGLTWRCLELVRKKD